MTRMLALVTSRASQLTDMRLEAAERLNQVGFLTWESGQERMTLSVIARELLHMPEAVPVATLLALIDPQERLGLQRRWDEALAGRHHSLSGEFAAGSAGQWRRYGVCVLFTYGTGGMPVRCVIALQDVTSQGEMIKALSDSEARLSEAQEIAQFGYWEIDFERRSAMVSAQARMMWGLPAGWQCGGRGMIEVVPQEQREWVSGLYEQAFKERQTSLRYDVRKTDAEGATREFHSLVKIDYRPDGRPRRMLATLQDITELKSHRRQLHSLSFFDSVTGLPNRALFIDRLNQALADASWQNHQLGLIMLDLDRFKNINDSLGHAIGDALLKHVAQRLQQVMRGYDTVARLGGDEFAVVLPNLRQASDMDAIVQKVMGAFAQPFEVAGQEVFVTASVGGAFYPSDAQDAPQLMQFADAAMYHAKAQGRNNFRLYARELTTQASERLSLESELRKAIELGELALHYQPKFDLASGRLVGAEALMRWNHPQRGLVPPLSFIATAEDTGLIVPMGAWALHTACHAAAKWNQGRTQPLKIAVNLSARQFIGVPFSTTVSEALAASGCKPEWLELEITESLLLDGRQEILTILQDIAACGISIALDDFGTGYSALSYLTRFPVDTLKIDRSFIKDLPGDRGSAELVKAIVSLAHSLNMNLVAEGVETREQADHLVLLGCELVQGYLYGRPVSQEAFTGIVESFPV